MSSIAQIREQIDELSYAERVELSEWLQLTTPVEEEEDQAYLDEILALAEKRSEELRAGKVIGIPWEEVKRQLDATQPT
ncbi:Putative addiction module component [Prosthecobacter debontii]|uniref:Putative addiction module component n=1 Tax=Prosthecobacter debontii TaxID=48467 RepID=A0A1T4WVK1_9BACT|nr:addiction module protein [Prosthecobacter debontii]SKA81157.1 Putative addiction module component [Prosthecobacter debontii]